MQPSALYNIEKHRKRKKNIRQLNLPPARHFSSAPTFLNVALVSMLRVSNVRERHITWRDLALVVDVQMLVSEQVHMCHHLVTTDSVYHNNELTFLCQQVYICRLTVVPNAQASVPWTWVTGILNPTKSACDIMFQVTEAPSVVPLKSQTHINLIIIIIISVYHRRMQK